MMPKAIVVLPNFNKRLLFIHESITVEKKTPTTDDGPNMEQAHAHLIGLYYYSDIATPSLTSYCFILSLFY